LFAEALHVLLGMITFSKRRQFMEEKTIKEVAKEALARLVGRKKEEVKLIIIASARVNPGTKTYTSIRGTLFANERESYVIEFGSDKRWEGDTLCMGSEVYILIYSDK